jgi:hypothetical protein
MPDAVALFEDFSVINVVIKLFHGVLIAHKTG